MASMVSFNLYMAAVVLLSGFLILGLVEPSEAVCNLACVQGAYITCSNYPDQRLYGCNCKCAPADGKDCVVHLGGGSSSTKRCWKCR